MKKLIVLLIIHCFITSLFAQSDKAERNKERAAIEKLNKEMERVSNSVSLKNDALKICE